MRGLLVILNTFLILILCSQQFVAADDDEEEYCECVNMQVNGDAGNCCDGAPIVVSLSISQEAAEGDGPDLVYLVGSVDITDEIPKDDALTVDVKLALLTSTGQETVWSGSFKLCDLLEKEEDPFKDFAAIFGGKCPIAKGTYEVKKMLLDFSFLAPYLTEDWLGKYILIIQISKAMDCYLCMESGAVVDNLTQKCKQCPSDSRK